MILKYLANWKEGESSRDELARQLRRSVPALNLKIAALLNPKPVSKIMVESLFLVEPASAPGS